MLRPERIVPERLGLVGLVLVHPRVRGEVHDRVGSERLDRAADGVVIPDVQRRVIERAHVVVGRHAGQERPAEVAAGAGHDQPHARVSTVRGAVTTGTTCADSSASR